MAIDHPRAELSTSEREWLQVREYLREHRHTLALSAAADFPSKVESTPLLTRSRWIPAEPMDLRQIDLEWVPDVPFHGVTGTESDAPLPARQDGRRYASYSEAIGALEKPAVFENRSTYRLVDADLSGPRGHMVFTQGRYFDGIDTGEAAAHEYAASAIGRPAGALRSAVGDPCDPARRPMNVAISTLTIRHDRATGASTFFLHWRDPAKVGHAGGLYQVLPVGIFQASGEASWNQANDFSLWRNIIRELAEELRGDSEDYGSETAPIDYESWPFANHMTRALQDGGVAAYCLGLGVDPLTFATDLLTAVIVDAPLFDELFADIGAGNAEGRILAPQPFEKSCLESIVNEQPMQAAGAAVLSLAARASLLRD